MNTKNIQRPGPDVEARVGHRQLIRLIGIHPKDDENTEKQGDRHQQKWRQHLISKVIICYMIYIYIAIYIYWYIYIWYIYTLLK